MIFEIQLLLHLISAMQKNDLCINVYHMDHYGIKCLSNPLQLERCNVMFKVISDMMAQWNYVRNSIVIAINFCNGKKMICALMFIISKHYGIKCLIHLIQLEPCNAMLKVISDLMAH